MSLTSIFRTRPECATRTQLECERDYRNALGTQIENTLQNMKHTTWPRVVQSATPERKKSGTLFDKTVRKAPGTHRSERSGKANPQNPQNATSAERLQNASSELGARVLDPLIYVYIYIYIYMALRSSPHGPQHTNKYIQLIAATLKALLC